MLQQIPFRARSLLLLVRSTIPVLERSKQIHRLDIWYFGFDVARPTIPRFVLVSNHVLVSILRFYSYIFNDLYFLDILFIGNWIEYSAQKYFLYSCM